MADQYVLPSSPLRAYIKLLVETLEELWKRCGDLLVWSCERVVSSTGLGSQRIAVKCTAAMFFYTVDCNECSRLLFAIYYKSRITFCNYRQYREQCCNVCLPSIWLNHRDVIMKGEKARRCSKDVTKSRKWLLCIESICMCKIKTRVTS